MASLVHEGLERAGFRAVMKLSGVTWRDLGSPRRAMRRLRKTGIEFLWLDRLTPAV